MLKKYFCPEIQNDNYKLSKLEIYYAPPESNIATVQEYLDTLPLDEDPEVFGLHPNANMMYEKGIVQMFMENVLLIQPRLAAGGAGESPEEKGRRMAQEFSKLLPGNIDRDAAHPDVFKFDDNGKPLSLGTFCGQELDRFNLLLNVMRKSLV